MNRFSIGPIVLVVLHVVGCEGMESTSQISLRSRNLRIGCKTRGTADVGFRDHDCIENDRALWRQYSCQCDPESVETLGRWLREIVRQQGAEVLSESSPDDCGETNVWIGVQYGDGYTKGICVSDEQMCAHPFLQGLQREIEEIAGHDLLFAIEMRRRALRSLNGGQMRAASVKWDHALRWLVDWRIRVWELSGMEHVEDSELAITDPRALRLGEQFDKAVEAYDGSWNDLFEGITTRVAEDGVTVVDTRGFFTQ